MVQDFAAIDDALVYHGGFCVYSHALVQNVGLPQVLLIEGWKTQVYGHEDDILAFIAEFLPSGSVLYGCSHYRNYPMAWDMMTPMTAEAHKDRAAHQLFIQAHHQARNAARRRMEKLLEERLPLRPDVTWSADDITVV